MIFVGKTSYFGVAPPGQTHILVTDETYLPQSAV